MVPSALQNALQKRAVNWGPQSETISQGMLCNLMTCVIRICAVSEAEGSFVRGMKCAALEKRSTTVRMVVWWWWCGGGKGANQ